MQSKLSTLHFPVLFSIRDSINRKNKNLRLISDEQSLIDQHKLEQFSSISQNPPKEVKKKSVKSSRTLVGMRNDASQLRERACVRGSAVNTRLESAAAVCRHSRGLNLSTSDAAAAPPPRVRPPPQRRYRRVYISGQLRATIPEIGACLWGFISSLRSRRLKRKKTTGLYHFLFLELLQRRACAGQWWVACSARRGDCPANGERERDR